MYNIRINLHTVYINHTQTEIIEMAHGQISEKKVQISLVIPKELKSTLSEIATEENRSLNNLIVTILANYVKTLPKEES